MNHTPGPWKVVVREFPHHRGGKHIERSICTAWEHPQLKDSAPVVTMGIGIGAEEGGKGIHFIHIDEADAAYIVKACNAHEGIVAALQRQITTLNDTADGLESWARASLEGGWSTHQVEANRKTADGLRIQAGQLAQILINAERGT